MEFNNENGIFLNGKAQIVEMLQIMAPGSKEKLLRNIRMRNPALANELTEQSLTFDDLDNLDDADIINLFSYVKAPIIGVALKNVKVEFQRRVLGLAPRTYAEEAFSIMNKDLREEKSMIKKAQQKVIDTLVSLSRRGRVSL
jgi:flagellar motor switch protein FliG